MKKMIIGAVVGTLIYFSFQAIMWMGGFHKDFYTYAAKQDTVLSSLSASLPAEGLYMMPMADPGSPDFKARQEHLEKTMIGNPWAMVFYHPKMEEFSARYLIMGILYAFIGALIAAFVIYTGKFTNFWSRFAVSMLFAVFTIVQGVLSNMNWWSFPWGFIKPQVMDLALGWGLCSLWLGWFVKRRTAPVQDIHVPGQ
jgi:hypothetical protein